MGHELKMRLARAAVLLCATYLGMSICAGYFLAEFTLHPYRNHLRYRARAVQIAAAYGAGLQEVTVEAKDGALLRGWFARPAHDNGRAVILLHGVSDTREGMGGFAQMFLRNHYSVLLPDARAHGESGGEFASYGLREADDVHHWLDWLERAEQPSCIYGLGESMGAAILLDSLSDETRFCAVTAESAFARFRLVAY